MAASTFSSSSLQRTCFKPQTPIARHYDSIPRPRSTKNVVAGRSGLELLSGQALQIKRQEGGHMREWRRNQGINVRAAKRKDCSRSFLMSSTLVAKEEEEHKVAELCQSITQWAKEKQFQSYDSRCKGEWSLKKVLEMVRGENKEESNGVKSRKWNIPSLFGNSEK